MLPKITIELLEKMATPQSLMRGYDYYKVGVVLNLKVKNDSYIATVSGTYEYNVTISESNGEVIFNCTCPYDLGGICKHCVAVGLEIIKKVKTPSIQKDKEQKKGNKAFIDFKRNIYQKASEEIKEEFLLNILKENQIYQKQFATLVLGQKDVETKL
ncbi:MAG: SWIM zinc finger family protein, partial [Candidatus Cloacimonetes bacterium]|nr:SWIM zinc finger family protein [Candidatus Cloacimonadota bacterium]